MGPTGPASPQSLLYLVDFQEAVHLAAFILLLLHLLAEALSPALLNSVWVLKGPASTAIRFPHILASVTAPVGEEEQVRVSEKHKTVLAPWEIKPEQSCLLMEPLLASSLTIKCSHSMFPQWQQKC